MEENWSMEGGRGRKYGGCKFGGRKRMEVWRMVDRRMKLWKLEENGSMNDGSMAGWRELKYEWWLILEKWKVEDNGSMEGGREWKYGSMEGGR